MAPINELSVLRKLEPARRRDEGSWPEFPLHNVVVRNKLTNEPFNLLSAYVGDLAYIEGALYENEIEEQDRISKNGFKKANLRVENVRIYSYGINDDMTTSFWAAGEVGWYEFRSVAVSYQPIYEQMGEATSTLYYLADKVKNARKTFIKAPFKEIDEHVRTVIRNYRKSEQNQGRRGNAQECFEAFEQNRFFLIKCMHEGAEQITWSGTPFWKWFNKQYPDDFAFMQRVVNQTASGPIPVNRQTMSESDTEMPVQTPEPVKRVESRPVRRNSTPPAPSRPVGRSNRYTRGQAAAANSGLGSSDDDSTRRNPRPRRHKRKSMLRPPGGKTPKKSHQSRDNLRAYRNPSVKDVRHEQMELDDGDVTDASTEERIRQLERRLSAGQVTTTGDEESRSSDDEDEDGENGGENGDQSIRNDNANRTSKSKTKRPVPNAEYYEPHGPSDTWTCPYEGCSDQVWDARSPTGVYLIQQHYEQAHQNSVEDMVKSEERPWAHVDNLLAKIRSFQEQQAKKQHQEGLEENGVSVGGAGKKGLPSPIRRKL